MLPSLPDNLLGIYNTTQFTIHSFRPQKNDQLILLSSPEISANLYQLSNTPLELNTISKSITEGNPDLPYWVGLLNL